MKKIVTFDFDSTLDREDVQKYANYLIKKGITVWVLTSRYDDLHRHRYPYNPTNTDLYKVTDKLGINRANIRFQCMRLKSEYLHLSNVIWHLDDDSVELNSINKETNTIGISVLESDWIQKCNKLLENEIYKEN